jgi:Pan3 Pseudokinase domain
MLVSRDEQNCLVVSYKEVKSCIESAFRCVSWGPDPSAFSYTLRNRKVTWRVRHLCGDQQHKTVESEKDVENTEEKKGLCLLHSRITNIHLCYYEISSSQAS